MISLILRCKNRLQYTIRCMEALARQKGAPPFEVVVVDNDSTDGTREWFRSIQENEGTRTYFPPIRYVRVPLDPDKPEGRAKNFGDWGGMVHGAQHVLPKAEIIGQLDNDIELPPTALALCAGVLAHKMAFVVMIKRRGVRQPIRETKKAVKRTIAGTSFGLQPVEFCVAFWLTGREHFGHAATHMNCRKFTMKIRGCKKVLALQALHMEGWEMDGPRTYTQKRKYNLDKWQAARKRGLL